jgi:hypothetical protein
MKLSTSWLVCLALFQSTLSYAAFREPMVVLTTDKLVDLLTVDHRKPILSEEMLLILKQTSDAVINGVSGGGWTPLLMAAKHGCHWDQAIFEHLVGQSTRITINHAHNGETALSVFSFYAEVEYMKLILNAGGTDSLEVKIPAANEHPAHTPLEALVHRSTARECDKIPALQLLIEHGASVPPYLENHPLILQVRAFHL